VNPINLGDLLSKPKLLTRISKKLIFYFFTLANKQQPRDHQNALVTTQQHSGNLSNCIAMYLQLSTALFNFICFTNYTLHL